MNEIADNQMALRIDSDKSMVQCECKAIIMLEKSQPDFN